MTIEKLKHHCPICQTGSHELYFSKDDQSLNAIRCHNLKCRFNFVRRADVTESEFLKQIDNICERYEAGYPYPHD